MRPVLFFLVLAVIGGCASKGPTSAEARKALDEKYSPKVGVATKADLMEEFGNAEWCQPKPTGEETCRFYRKKATKWVGEKRDKKSYEAYDEVVADFDSNGVLKSFKSSAQR